MANDNRLPEDICAALSALTYQLQGVDVSELKLGDLLTSTSSYATDEVKEIIRANGLEQARVLDVSWCPAGSYGTMNAMTVEIGGQLYIAYRGTGEGNWKYNADSAFGPEASDMQKWASDYFDYVMGQYGKQAKEVYVTGHSQGGNNAMYTLLFAEHADRITNCISLDGPGFSQPIIADAIFQLGTEEYQSRLEKIYAIYGENDYVHGLGEVHIVPKDHIYYVPTPNVTNPALYHDLFTHMTNGKLNERYPQGEGEGPISQMITSIMENMPENLSAEERYEVAQHAMDLVEWRIGEGKDNPDFADKPAPKELLYLIEKLGPVLVETVFENPDQILSLLQELEVGDWILEHPLETIAILAVAQTALSVITPVAVVASNIIFTIVALQTLITAMEQLDEAFKTVMLEMLQATLNHLEQFYNWLTGSAGAAANYVTENPYFQVDTVRLRDYADRIDRINQRLRQLDSDMNGLYWQVGLLDIWDILMANLITGGSPTLRQVSSYLRDAADQMELADRTAMGYMGG